MRNPTGSPPLIVGLGGAARTGSTSERVLAYALRVAAKSGASTLLFTARDIDLPMYRPEQPERTAQALRLISALRAADGLIVATPSYHGSLSGLVKNALDYAEDLRADARPYLEGRTLGCIVTGAGWQAPAATLSQLRAIGHALRAWPTPLGVAINSAEGCFDEDGDPAEPYREQLLVMAGQVARFAASPAKVIGG